MCSRTKRLFFLVFGNENRVPHPCSKTLLFQSNMKYILGPFCFEERLSVGIVVKHMLALMLAPLMTIEIISTHNAEKMVVIPVAFSLLALCISYWFNFVPPTQKALYFRDRLVFSCSIESLALVFALCCSLLSSCDVSDNIRSIIKFFNLFTDIDETPFKNVNRDLIAVLARWLVYHLGVIVDYSLWQIGWFIGATVALFYVFNSLLITLVQSSLSRHF